MNPRDLLQQRFGFADFRPGQREVIDALLTGGRALAVFPTGGGKSICYQLPALALDGVTVVVSPLIAVMKDQIDFLRGRGIEAARLDSSLPADEARAMSDRLASGALKLLYVAPERFNNERFLETLRRTKISLFAIDEAHCISEWGHNFRPDYLKLAAIARELGAERILTLTATATPAVVKDISLAFDIPEEGAIVTGFYRPNLTLEITPVTSAERDELLTTRLRTRSPGSTIVYVTLQKTAERVAESLKKAGLPAAAYHAGMESADRARIQDAWMASPRGIVVATIAFGMGIDKADVRYVYHYNLPKSLESYSQEIGRAGRDGLPSVVEMLACPDDVPTLENFAYGDTPSERAVHGLLDELFAKGEAFDVALTELADRHDLRILVLRTALTYLELLGVLRQGTPYYAGYAIRPKLEPEEIAAEFRGEHAAFIRDLFRHAKRGRTWFRLDPGKVARAMGQDRARVVRAVDVLETRGYAEVTASDVRQRYTLAKAPSQIDVDALARDLSDRFARREAQEIARVAQVRDLALHQGCHANALVAHFGEQRAEPCGHCVPCLAGQARPMPPAAAPRAIPGAIDVRALASLRATHPEALAEPRQLARFLCGLGTPGLSRKKLTRHPLFGALEESPFGDVLAWCEVPR